EDLEPVQLEVLSPVDLDRAAERVREALLQPELVQVADVAAQAQRGLPERAASENDAWTRLVGLLRSLFRVALELVHARVDLVDLLLEPLQAFLELLARAGEILQERLGAFDGRSVAARRRRSLGLRGAGERRSQPQD